MKLCRIIIRPSLVKENLEFVPKIKIVYKTLIIFVSEMKVNLRQNVLNEIVESGVKEMLLGFNISRGAKKNLWFKKLGEIMTKYKLSIIDMLVPTIIADFGGSIAIKMTGTKMQSEEVEKVKRFSDMILASKVKKYEISLLEEMEKSLKESGKDRLYIEELLKIAKNHHQWIIRRFDAYIREEMFNNLKKNVEEKCKLDPNIFNFTNKNIPDEVKKLFENGVEAVPKTSMKIGEIKTRVKTTLIAYLKRYRSRRGRKRIKTGRVKEWLNVAINLEGIEEDIKFYKQVLEEYDGMMSEIELNYHHSDDDTEEQMKKRMDIDECIMIYCDKNLGMSMFTLEQMREADKNLMNQFGAKFVNKSEEEIFKEVLSEIDEFEEALDKEQKEYLDYSYSNRNLHGIEVKMPFLRSTHKVQKMTTEEIENKDTSNLKFRPVIDAKSWTTRGYATLVMGMIRKANEELVNCAGSVLRKSKIKNGWRFSKEMTDFETDKKYCILVSADIQEAYTNIKEEMINTSIEQVCNFLEWPKWKINLMTKLITLILKNNYVKTSAGVYLFKRVLPMGYKLSGECLDIVGLSGEFSRMYRLGDENDKMKGIPIAELMEYPDEIIETSVEREINMVNGILSYKRYVDDTHIVIGGDEVQEVIDGLFAVGYMFPSGLVINIDCNIWRSEFLDVFTWRNLEGARMSTMVKKNFKVPFGHV